MRFKRVFAASLIGLSAILGGCQCEKLFPDKVAMGVARLSVRNVGTAISLIANDAKCGFATPDTISRATFSSAVGTSGTMTARIDNCTLDLGSSLALIATDCSGVETRAMGTVTVSGTQTIRGRITGNPKTPMVPAAADAVSFDLTMTFSNYEVRASNSKAGLRIDSGSAAVKAEPHLGVSASTGVCAVATTDLTVTSIQYSGAHLEVDPDSGFFPVDVPSSDFGAQAGRWNGRENDLTGKVTVWDHESAVPTSDDHDGLDPAYKRADFEAAIACTKDLAQPLSYQCADLDAILAENLARLTVATFGQLANYFDEDKVCGFASAAAQQAQTISGADVGLQGATVHIPLTTPCVLTFDQPTVIKTSCNGVKTIVQGTVSGTGVKEVAGLNTGNAVTPIVPATRQPSNLTMQMDLTGLKISRSDMPVELQLKSGTLSGRANVVLGLDTSQHACAIKSSAAQLDDIKLVNADAAIVNDGSTFGMPSAGADLAAVNGRVGGQENALSGSVTLGSRNFPEGTASSPLKLDPNYDFARFQSDDACLPHFQATTSDTDCDLYPLLGGIAARLTVQTAGAIASLVNADKHCGFSDTLGVLLWPSSVVGNAGEMGSMTWNVTGCDVGSGAPAAYGTNCQQTESVASGSASTNATRTVLGLREKKYLLVDSIVPKDPKSVTISIDQAVLTEFSSYDLPANASSPPTAVTWHSGTLAGVVEPYTGENATNPGTYDIPTPLAAFHSLSATNADLTMVANGLTFRVLVNQASLTAQNGVFHGQGNSISGDITVDGHAIHIDPGPLNPDYDQAKFDGSYACTADLVTVLPSSP